MKVVQFAPCSGWYFKGTAQDGPTSFYKVAAWALTDTGVTYGLIAVHEGRSNDRMPILVAPPTALSDATYVTEDEVTALRAAESSTKGTAR